MKTMLAAKDLHFSYDDTPIIRGVSLEVRAGEILGILGPNGAGKSTLLGLLAGALESTEGEVMAQEKKLAALSARERAQLIAWLPQENHIPFSFTALEIVLMGRAPHLSPFGFESAEDLAIAQRAMEATDTTRFAHRSIHELSGGEHQRVLLACALAQRTPVLLLDEPTTFLDLRHGAELAERLRRLAHDEGLAIAIVLHDINMAATLCDRMVLMREGAIAANGHPRTIITSEMMAAVFGADVHIGWDETRGVPYCTYLKRKSKNPPSVPSEGRGPASSSARRRFD